MSEAKPKMTPALPERLMSLRSMLVNGGFGGDTACLEDAADLLHTHAALVQKAAEADALSRERDALRGALERMVNIVGGCEPKDRDMCWETIQYLVGAVLPEARTALQAKEPARD